MNSLLLSLDDANLGYTDFAVLRHFSWQVHRAQRWAVVGANGAGKTTLIRTILGLLPLKSGSLTYYAPNGKPTSKASIGYLPQVNHIDRQFPINVYRVVESGLYGTSLNKEEMTKRIHSLIESVGLTEHTYTALGNLSGGQVQRALLARALASQPELLVLDEPTSFLDRSYKQHFNQLLTSLTPAQSTIIMVTHELPQTYESSWQTLVLGSM